MRNRNISMRLFAFMLVCALLVSANSFTAAAEKTEPVTAQAVAQQEGATVLTQAEPAPAGLSPDSATGYIEKDNVDVILNEEDTDEGLTYAQALLLRRQVVSMLESFLGTPYVWGGIYPGGFDCSGLVYYIYGKLDMPVSRCADTQLLNDGTPVASEDLLPGDLVFFREYGSPWVASHVGIYVGNRMMIHASNSGVRYDSLDKPYYANIYVGARRLIHVSAGSVSTDLPSLNLR